MYKALHNIKASVAGLILGSFLLLLMTSVIQPTPRSEESSLSKTGRPCIVALSPAANSVFRHEERAKADLQFSLSCVEIIGVESGDRTSSKIRFENQAMICFSIKPIDLTLLSTLATSSSL